jgi:hypothetical protein
MADDSNTLEALESFTTDWGQKKSKSSSLLGI